MSISSLANLAATAAAHHNLSGPINPTGTVMYSYDLVEEAKLWEWDRLKLFLPNAPIPLMQMMHEIDPRLPGDGVPANGVNQLFQRFIEKLTPYFNAHSIPEKSRLVLEMPLSALQLLQTQSENEALLTIWQQRLASVFNVLNLQTHEEVRTWMNNPANAVQLQQVTTLDLSRLNLKVLPPEIGKLTALQTLNLEYNELTFLPVEIRSLTALQELFLFRNKLISLPPEIGNLTALQKLQLAANPLTSLPPEFGNLRALRTLHLYGCKLTSLPTVIYSLTDLQQLHLSLNKFTSLSPEFGNLRALRTLYLSGCQLTSLPTVIYSLTTLKELRLDNNMLTSLSPEIGSLINLETLHLDHNMLTSLPPEIGRSRALEMLHLEYNKLKSLPPEIGSLKALKRLELTNNELMFLPPEIGNLKALNWLQLSNNQLMFLPPEIGSLKALIWLQLRNNQLTSLPPEICSLSALQFLEINDNQLMSLPPEIGKLTHAHNLNIFGNPLMFLSDNEIKKSFLLESIVAHYQKFINYPTQSSLGNLFKLIATNENPANIQNAFEELDPALQQHIANLAGVPVTSTSSSSSVYIHESLFDDIPRLGRAVRKATFKMYNDLTPQDKKKVCGKIWELAGKPKTRDPKWGEQHAFDDMLRFVDALESVREQTAMKKKAAIEKFNRLSPQQKNKVYGKIWELAGKPKTRDPKWGEHHAFDDLLRFVDALEQVTKKE